MTDQKELTDELERITNRHTARILTDLEAANCPTVYVQAVKAEMQWLRSDLKELTERKEPNGNQTTPRI